MLKKVRINSIVKISSERRKRVRGYFADPHSITFPMDKMAPKPKPEIVYPIYAIKLSIPIIRYSDYNFTKSRELKHKDGIDYILRNPDSMGIIEHNARYIAHVRSEEDYDKINIYNFKETLSNRLSKGIQGFSFFDEKMYRFTTDKGVILEIVLPSYIVMCVDKKTIRDERLKHLGI